MWLWLGRGDLYYALVVYYIRDISGLYTTCAFCFESKIVVMTTMKLWLYEATWHT